MQQLVDVNNLVGSTEIAERLEVTRQAIDYWIASAGFPDPVRELSIGRVWDWDMVADWHRERQATQVTAARCSKRDWCKRPDGHPGRCRRPGQ